MVWGGGCRGLTASKSKAEVETATADRRGGTGGGAGRLEVVRQRFGGRVGGYEARVGWRNGGKKGF